MTDISAFCLSTKVRKYLNRALCISAMALVLLNLFVSNSAVAGFPSGTCADMDTSKGGSAISSSGDIGVVAAVGD